MDVKAIAASSQGRLEVRSGFLKLDQCERWHTK
jgi:hypothetical protein